MLPPNPQLAAALREITVPQNMGTGRALVDHLTRNAENGVPDGDIVAHLDKMIGLTALSVVEIIDRIGKQEANVRNLGDALKNLGKPRPKAS
jgi:hypothetical protein